MEGGSSTGTTEALRLAIEVAGVALWSWDVETDTLDLDSRWRVEQLLIEHGGRLWADEEWQMDVTEDNGLILFVIDVSALRSSATSDFRVE